MALPSYLAAFALIVFPIFDQLMQLVATTKLDDARWRFGAAGLLSNLFVLPVVGVMIVLVIAHTFGHRRFKRLMAVLCLLAAASLVVATGFFVLDAVQVRSLMRPEAQSSWLVATSTAVFKLLVTIVCLSGFGYASWRSSSASRSTVRRTNSTQLVGRVSSSEDAPPVQV